jgi:tagatose 6-phosphate kinase
VIVTLTLNPALHVSYETQRLTLGSRNKVSQVHHRAGGRGLAVARVLHTFGHEVGAAGLIGGASGEAIREELARAGVPAQFTWISGETRRVLEVTDVPDGSVTVFAEPAPYITTEELGRLAADYRSLMADASAAVLCGSLPTGLPAETYGSLASYAADAGVPVVLDAAGSALWHAVTRHPALVILDESDAADAEALVAKGAGAVAIVTNAGVRVVTGDGGWSAVLSGPGEGACRGERNGKRPATTSRDAMVAGFVPGTVLGWSWADTLAHAVALAASAGPGGDVDLEAYERLLPSVTVSSQPT